MGHAYLRMHALRRLHGSREMADRRLRPGAGHRGGGMAAAIVAAAGARCIAAAGRGAWLRQVPAPHGAANAVAVADHEPGEQSCLNPHDLGLDTHDTRAKHGSSRTATVRDSQESPPQGLAIVCGVSPLVGSWC